MRFQAKQEQYDGDAHEKQVGNNNCQIQMGKTERNTQAAWMRSLGQHHRFAASWEVDQKPDREVAVG